jgi:diketogulonate reductase-like aldo/keto reductase
LPATKPVALLTKSGDPLHPIGIGTWSYGTYPPGSPGTAEEISALEYAFSLGQNHIDAAEMYANGGAERVIGRAIERTDRAKLFVTSKLWKDHVADGSVRPAVEAMLSRLRTDYLDMLYIHAPWFDAPWQEAIPQIEVLIDEGVVRHFGVSNFNADRLKEALAVARHPIVANQMHYSPVHQQEVTPELQELCAANGITIVAYMPLEQGAVFNDPLIQRLAQKYDATPAQIALAWLHAQQALPIPKALRKAHINQNVAAKDINLSPEDVLAADFYSN